MNTPEIISLPARTFVGLQASFIVALSPRANNLKVIPPLWDRFDARFAEMPALDPAIAYGLCDRPDSMVSEDPDTALYLAAVECAADAPAPEGMVKWTAPAGAYAKFIHRGPVRNIGQTMGQIYGEWLPRSRYTRAKGPDIERMDARFRPEAEESVLEIYLPVREKTAAEA